MHIKLNKSIDLKSPRFTVDGPINKDVEKYDVLSTLNRASATAFVGTSGSGKTSLAVSQLTHNDPKVWKKQFEQIIVVMPRPSRASLKHNLFDKYLDPAHLYDAMTEESIDMIIAQVEASASQGERTLLILDDVASSLKNGYIAKKLQHLIYAYRHYRLNVLLLVQTLRTVPLSIRKNLTAIVVFHKPRPSEWKAIVDENLEVDDKTADQLYRALFKQKYDWGLIELGSGRIFSKFDEVLYRQDASEEESTESKA
jgi:hypothetical protein